jgi:hypothetical protein
MGLVEFREELWRRAGVSLEERAAALGEAFQKAKSLLNAKRTELVSYQGDYTPVEVEDNAAQLRAAAEIFDLSGVRVGKQEKGGGSGGPATIVLNLASWFQPERPVDVTPPASAGDFEPAGPVIANQESDAAR